MARSPICSTCSAISMSSTALSCTACSPTAEPRELRPGGVRLEPVGGRPPDGARRHRRHDRDEDRRVARDGHDGGAREAARARPREPRRDRPSAGPGRQTTRRLWLELGITTLADFETAARDGRLHGQAGFGEARNSNSWPSSRQALPRASEPSASIRRSSSHAPCSSRYEPTRPASRPTRARWSARRVGGRRGRDRRRDRRARPDAVAHRAAVRRRGARPRHDQGVDPDAQRRAAGPARRAPRELRQPPAALHRLEGPQRAHARGRPASRHERLGMGHRGRGQRRGLQDA